MASVIRRFADTPDMPWRNGLGRMWPLVGDDLAATLGGHGDWSLSVAHLEAPSSFSLIPDRHRTLVPWGGGIRLEIDGLVTDVAHGEPVRFSGAARTRLVALDAPCHALNLMASDPRLTLVFGAAGTRFDDRTITLLTEPTAHTARFDVVSLEPGEPLPTRAVVVRTEP